MHPETGMVIAVKVGVRRDFAIMGPTVLQCPPVEKLQRFSTDLQEVYIDVQRQPDEKLKAMKFMRRWH